MTNVMLEELLLAHFAQTSAPSSAAPGCLVRIYPNEGLGKMVSIHRQHWCGEFPGDESSTANTLLESADQMLYLAKTSGRNKVCFAGVDGL